MLEQGTDVATSAVALLNNLALVNKFKSQMRAQVEENLLPAFERLMVSRMPGTPGEIFDQFNKI